MDLEPLTTLAEVAIAFAGFASIVIVFGNRGRRGIPLVFRVATRGMLLCSLTVVFAAFLPFVLAKVQLTTLNLWQASHGCFLAILIILVMAAGKDGAKVKGAVALRIRVLGGIPLVLAIGFVCAGLFGWYPAAAYILALLTLMLLSAIHFVNIVMMYITPREE